MSVGIELAKLVREHVVTMHVQDMDCEIWPQYLIMVVPTYSCWKI